MDQSPLDRDIWRRGKSAEHGDNTETDQAKGEKAGGPARLD
jgi:hypothetical protein